MIYLIAHKAYGRATYDVAVKVDDMWILSDGHRAYPWWWMELEPYTLTDLSAMPSDARDSYQIEPRPAPRINKQKVMASLDDLLDLL